MSHFKLKATLTMVHIIFAGLLVSVRAREYNVGVSVNHWVRYENFLAIGPAFPEVNETQWMQINVVEVSGKNITLHVFREFKNGTTTSEKGISCNVETGWTNASLLENVPLMPLVIAAGLQAGDILPGTIPLRINKTETRDYGGLLTRVNILNLTMIDEFGNCSFFLFGWDKPSGILLELTVEIRTFYPQTYSYSKMAFSMANTNIPEFPSNMAFPTFAVLVLATVLCLKKKFSEKIKT